MTNRGPIIAGSTAAAAAVICTGLVATAAGAVDGEILITQGKVNAGGITPGDTAGFPALLSRPGRYKLAGNLTVPTNMNGIEVKANDVTLDLNGFTISGDQSGQAVTGIEAENVKRVRVANGTVKGFKDFGIAGGAFGVVENMRILSIDGGFGIGVMGYQSSVRNNTIVNCYLGVFCSQCLVEQNLINWSVTEGFYGVGGALVGNVIASNGLRGLLTGEGTTAVGYGNNLLFDNQDGSVSGNAIQQHPNACEPACP